MRTTGIVERKFVKIRNLPARPNLDQLRIQAKDLLKSYRAGEPDAVRRFHQSHPAAAQPTAGPELTLSDAQWVLAREYGFESWPKLKAHVDSILIETIHPLEVASQAFHNDDASLLRALFQKHPELKAHVNDPVPGFFDSPPITLVRSREMFDVLLEVGADINAQSRWWAGGFGLLHQASPELARHAIERGAFVDIHAAARLGMIDRVRELTAGDSALVHARGGDGQTPLHFALSVEIAEFLVDHGADMDARDVDHESTPAQYMLKERKEVARYLVQRGCATDIFMAAALGDVALARQHLDEDSECVRLRVSEEHFPMVGGRSGGTIYQWVLGSHVSPHQVARQFGHEEVFRLLQDRSPADVKLINAAWMLDEALVASLLAAQPNLAQTIDRTGRRQIAHAARNNNAGAVRLMLKAGLPADARSQHNGTVLHWAAWHGNVEMVKLLLAHQPPLEDTANDFKGSPLGWALHGSENSWHRETGDYPGAVEALLRAGAKPPATQLGSDSVRETLRKFAAS
jgi:ankyrin repeat protein